MLGNIVVEPAGAGERIEITDNISRARYEQMYGDPDIAAALRRSDIVEEIEDPEEQAEALAGLEAAETEGQGEAYMDTLFNRSRLTRNRTTGVASVRTRDPNFAAKQVASSRSSAAASLQAFPEN